MPAYYMTNSDKFQRFIPQYSGKTRDPNGRAGKAEAWGEAIMEKKKRRCAGKDVASGLAAAAGEGIFNPGGSRVCRRKCVDSGPDAGVQYSIVTAARPGRLPGASGGSVDAPPIPGR